MADKKSGKDLFQYLELYDETAEDYDKFAPLSMGAPGKETLLGCSDLMTRASKSVLVSFVCKPLFRVKFSAYKSWIGCRY